MRAQTVMILPMGCRTCAVRNRRAVQKREAEAEGSIPTPVQFETPPIDPASIPGLPNARELSSMTDEGVGRAGYLFQGHAVGEKRDVLPTHKFLHIFMQRTWDEMAQHKDAWPFLSPVDANEVSNGNATATQWRPVDVD